MSLGDRELFEAIKLELKCFSRKITAQSQHFKTEWNMSDMMNWAYFRNCIF